MPVKTLILGYDAVSCLGTDMDAQWQRALSGESGLSELRRIPVGPDFPVRVAGCGIAQFTDVVKPVDRPVRPDVRKCGGGSGDRASSREDP
ncbi:MAG TPA: hypothetical protein PK090_09355, partial [Smithellaceae bacterium]|nr:hypothetical protein [Smithellaceae bacterium]